MGEATKIVGKVTNVQAAGRYTARSGKNEGKTLYKYDVELDNGQAGQMASETEEAPVKVGEEVAINSYKGNSGYPDNWYLDRPKGGGYKGGGKQWTPDPERENRKERWAKQIMITRQACLNTACQLMSNGGAKADLKSLTETAEALEAWVKRGINLSDLVNGTKAAAATATNDAPGQYKKAPNGQIPDHDYVPF